MAGKSIGVKLVLKWQYDPDIERLSDLQQKQLTLESQLYSVETSYQAALKTMEKLQQR